MFGCAIAVRRMPPARTGSIVNISSIQGVAAWPRYFVYDAAKAAILMATKSVALDYAPHGLRCNVVLPGNIDTPMFRAGIPDGSGGARCVARGRGRAGPDAADRPARPRSPTSWHSSCRIKASFVNGAEVIVDGGAMVRCFAHPPIEVGQARRRVSGPWPGYA